MDEEKQVVTEEGRGLTFKDILFIIRKHWIAIIVFIFLGTAAGFTWTKVEQAVKPVYQSTGTMLVNRCSQLAWRNGKVNTPIRP